MSWLRSLLNSPHRLIGKLASDDYDTRKEARDSLVKMGKSATAALLVALKSDLESVRFEAVQALCLIDDDSAMDAVFDVVATDPYHMVRAYGLSAIANRHMPRLIGAVIIALNDENSVVRDHALHIIEKLEDQQVRAYVAQLAPAAIKALKRCERGMECGNECRALAHLGDKTAIPALMSHLRLLSSSDYQSSEMGHVVAALGKLQAAEAVDLIVERALFGRYAQRRAARALGDIGDKRAIEPLSRAFKSANNDDDRKTILEALQKLGAYDIVTEIAPERRPIDVARDETSTREALESIADSDDLSVVMALATNPATPAAVLRRLNQKWYHHSSSPRFLWGHFIKNRNCPSDLLTEIASNTTNPGTRQAAQRHPNFGAKS